MALIHTPDSVRMLLLAAFAGSPDVSFGADLCLVVRKAKRGAPYSLQTFECGLREREASVAIHFLVVVLEGETLPRIRLENSFQLAIFEGCDVIQQALCHAIVAHENYVRNAFVSLQSSGAETKLL